MKQSGYLNPSEETGTGCPVTSKYGRTPPSMHGGVGRQQHNKASGGFGSMWMTDLINNIVKEGCIPDDWRKSILVPV